MSRSKRQPLNRERVLDAATALADDGGIEALSMRKLAQALGVEAMSLYNHVANKDDLIDALVERVLREFELPDAKGDWEAAVRTAALSGYDAFHRHPWAVVPAVAPPRRGLVPTARVDYMEWLLGALRAGGFSDDLTYSGYHAIDSHIFGFALWQQGHTTRPAADVRAMAKAFMAERGGDYPHLVEHAQQHFAKGPDGREEFEFKLGVVLAGLEQLRDGSAGRSYSGT